MAKHPTIMRLDVRRFRGIENLEWRPAEGVNILVGGGDSGKSTVLHAISLLFSPTNSITVLETDYFNRITSAGFEIEATVALPEAVGISNLQQVLWPWTWNGKAAMLPNVDTPKSTETPVYRLKVRGTDDLDLIWEVIQPNDEAVALPVSLRRRIGVVRLTNDNRNDRDLRLVAGSALDRLLSSGNLKSRINQTVAATDIDASLQEREFDALKMLDGKMRDAGLPHDLGLGLTSSQGLSIGALIGLLAKRGDVNLPLASWGAGTRRMASLEIASSTEAATRLTIVDEIERGLEPYRLRQLIKQLADGEGQCFITTHSPVAVEAAADVTSALWFVDVQARVGALPHEIENQQRRDPETFLSKLPVVAEGVTEVGFLQRMFRNAFAAAPTSLGLRVCDGGGNNTMLKLLEALKTGGLTIGAFCDDEGIDSGRWKSVSEWMGPRFFQWHEGCLEENIINFVTDEQLLALTYDPRSGTGDRMRTLAVRLGIKDKSEHSILQACGPEEIRFGKLRSVIIEAATGKQEGATSDEAKKEWKSHSRRWFKSLEGGCELFEKAVQLGVWPKVEPQLLPFINGLRASFNQPPLSIGELKP